jgi:ABC-type multidrug transport system ATPase subunit
LAQFTQLTFENHVFSVNGRNWPVDGMNQLAKSLPKLIGAIEASHLSTSAIFFAEADVSCCFEEKADRMQHLAIQTVNLTFRRGDTPVINDLNLHVPQGSIFGLLGPNGSGKTTTIRLLLGLLRPASGTAHILGLPFEKHQREILTRIGSLVELPTLYLHLTGYENLEINRLLRNLPKTHIASTLQAVGLESFANKKVGTYSLGMRQRLGIALALVGNPELLILDEPTNGLDPAGILDMRNLILELNREHGKTILISSHILPEVEKIATDLAILNDGRMLYQGSLEELKSATNGQASDLESIFLTLTQYQQ